jgi:hypothetical protein
MSMNEREKFEAWWPNVSQIVGNVATIGKVTAWEAWKARALIQDEHALDCPDCDGTGDGDTSGDPQNGFPCPECDGDGVASWV